MSSIEWDPGGWEPEGMSEPNSHVRDCTVSALSPSKAPESDVQKGRTELDSHANMAVVGRHCSILRHTGRKVDVTPFTPDYDALEKIPVVDAVLLYECPYEGREVLLLIQDALYVPAMENNLIPPFLMRETGLVVNDTAKIHLSDPTEDDCAIIFLKSDFWIPL